MNELGWGELVVAARETTLQELLGGAKQYQVPLYQRSYSWGKSQLVKLWEDIRQLANDRTSRPELTHFIGSLVLAPSPANGPAGVQDWLVVDGQQRLTTLSVLMCALRDYQARETPSERDRINDLYLVNKWHADRHLKLLPTQADRPSYLACVDGAAQAGGADPIGTSYRFFVAELTSLDEPGELKRIEEALMSGLAIVAVTAGAGDNAYRIFESLNNTGLKLTQADLLRNYLFMRLPNRGNTVYQSLWLPLQQLLTPEQLETLFWLDVVQRDPRVTQTEIYAEQQRRLDRLSAEEDIEAEIARFNKLGTLLKLILQPSSEADPEVRLRLTRLDEWGSTTAYPILLYLLELRDQGKASSAQIARAMLYLESFFVRRLIVGRATANLNRILSSVVNELDETRPVDEAIRVSLSTGRTYYATDEEIKNAAPTIPFYLNGRANQRKLVLQWLEESYGSREPVFPGKLTIEHIMPQTPTQDWRDTLSGDIAPGQTFDQMHQAIVHTVGNLTLTGYNTALSNSPFGGKKDLLAQSGLVMNREIAGMARWGASEIGARAAQLADRIIRIWPGPADEVEPVNTAWEVAARALAQIPAGAWTTYGDIAALIGSHPIAVGTRLATQPAPNAHRVLQVNGRVSENFRWLEPGRSDDPRAILESEGVVFDEHGRADPQQRLNVEDLAQLAGVTTEEPPEFLPEPSADDDYLNRFEQLMTAHQTTATIEGIDTVVTAWTDMGGGIWWGRGSETSCFLVARKDDHRLGNIWPVVLYPSGKCEVVFQHMSIRPPFDDVQLREEFRQRLNKIPGVDLPSSKLELRPGFPLSVLSDEEARSLFLDALGWFYLQANFS